MLKGLNIVKGKNIDLIAGRGKNVFVIEFWATWCPPCVKSIPHLTQLAQKYAARDVVFLGITNERETGKIEQFVNNMGAKMDYNVAIDVEGHVYQEYMESNRIQGIPHAFVIGKDGLTAWHGHPLELEEHLVEAVEKKSLPDVRDAGVLATLSVKELKQALQSHNIPYSDCIEKSDLLNRIKENINKF